MKRALYVIVLLLSFSLNAQTSVDLSSYKGGKLKALSASSSSSIPIDDQSDSVNALLEDDFPLKAASKAATRIGPDVVSSNSRSARDASLFKATSPAVVLVLTKDGIGSGSLVSNNGEIITNWHVVGNNKEVGIIFKPEKDTQKISKDDLVRGRVTKVDQVADLALVQVDYVPANRKPLRLGTEEDISIGSDVHAIGHPKGESWTYTKGVVSQYRNDYEWSAGKGTPKHKASVIQTQTPINPGNSGGPLLADNGVLVGVNSFKAGGSEGLNFAVSIEDVKKFISSPNNRYVDQQRTEQPKKTSCKVKQLNEGESADHQGYLIVYDSNCDGKADAEIYLPYDKSKPMVMRLDRTGSGKIDAIIISEKRDGKWNISLWDDNGDGKWDLVGFHKNGDAKRYKYEPYSKVMAGN